MVACEVLEHIPTDRREASIREMVRVLAAGGRLIATVPADEAGERLDRRLNDTYRRFHGVDHPWISEHLATGLPRTEEVLSTMAAASPPGSRLAVHKHLWGPAWYAMHWVYTARGLPLMMWLLGVNTRLGARAAFWLLSRLNFGTCYRRIFVLDKGASS